MVNENKVINEDEEAKIRKMLNRYADSNPFRLNPDQKVVDRVISGLVMRKKKYGHAYCPCRIVTGNPENDKKAICPCVYHVEEIKQDGECHCKLFVSANEKGD